MADPIRLPRDQRRSPSLLSSFIRWLKIKNYQYEVTFSLYMLTSTEKVIFNLILLVLISMLVTAASLYLPNHVAEIYTRIWYYVHGEFANITSTGSNSAVDVPDVTADLVKTTASYVQSAVSATAGAVREAMGEL